MSNRIARMLVTVASLLALACVCAPPALAQQKDVVDTAIAAGGFTTLVAAVQAADLAQVLKGPGPYTVFAPTDEAFAKIPKADLEALMKDKTKLAAVLKHHVFAGSANAQDLAMLKDLSVVDGGRLPIQAGKGTLMVGGAKVVKADIVVANGIIHAIDTVLIPK